MRKPRDRHRKQRVLEAAQRLFRERGFHAVGMADIGEAAGISGPAVYRHFSGKEELLVAALRGGAEELWRTLDIDDRAAPAAVLEAYVQSHIAFTLAHPQVIGLWYQEWPNLPPAARAQLRRLQAQYVSRWVQALLAVRPHLAEPDARVMVHSVIGMIHSVVHYDTRRSAAETAHLLSVMEAAALAAL